MAFYIATHVESYRIIAAHATARLHTFLPALFPLCRQIRRLAERLLIVLPFDSHSQRTAGARGRLRSTHDSPQLHDSLRVVRGRRMRHQLLRCFPTPLDEFFLRFDLVNGAESRENAHHIAIHRCFWLVECDRQDGSRGVVAYARDFLEFFLCGWNFAVAVLHDVLQSSRGNISPTRAPFTRYWARR